MRKRETDLSSHEYVKSHIVADEHEPGEHRVTAHMHQVRYAFAASHLSPGSRAVDVGCATGYGTEQLARSGAELVGLDYHPAAVETAQKRFGNDRLRFVQGDCTALPFEAQSLDVAVAFDLIEHLEEPAALLREVRRVLRPGGKFVLSTPNKLVSDLSSGKIYEFHVREYYLSEFRAELTPHFDRVDFHGQYPGFVDDVRAQLGPYRPQSRFWFVPARVRAAVGTPRVKSALYKAMGLTRQGLTDTQLGRMSEISPSRVDVAHDLIAVCHVA